MADRSLTVLNPNGYQELLQTTDRLVIASSSLLAATELNDALTGTTASFTGNVTINGTPSADTDATTVSFVNTAIAGVTLTASAPISINNLDIQIAAATESSAGSTRYATNAECISNSSVDAAVKPNQLPYILDDLTFVGTSPLTIAESPANTYTIGVNESTTTTTGIIRLSTTSEAAAGTVTSTAMTPKNVADAITAIPDSTDTARGLIRIATSTEATTGTASDIAVTPAQLTAKVDTVDVTATLPLTVSQTNREFNLSANYATTSTSGVIRLATSSEITAGTATNVAITPANLETRLNGLEIVSADTTNEGLIEIATNDEVVTGTDSDRAITAAGLRYALDQTDYLLDGGTY
tara:strand:- start:2130 stop:3191 length:1062 start_codon:yes stop_codon:yes gene_type:complete